MTEVLRRWEVGKNEILSVYHVRTDLRRIDFVSIKPPMTRSDDRQHHVICSFIKHIQHFIDSQT